MHVDDFWRLRRILQRFYEDRNEPEAAVERAPAARTGLVPVPRPPQVMELQPDDWVVGYLRGSLAAAVWEDMEKTKRAPQMMILGNQRPEDTSPLWLHAGVNQPGFSGDVARDVVCVRLSNLENFTLVLDSPTSGPTPRQLAAGERPFALIYRETVELRIKLRTEIDALQKRYA